jgi:hypothetical protein
VKNGGDVKPRAAPVFRRRGFSGRGKINHGERGGHGENLPAGGLNPRLERISNPNSIGVEVWRKNSIMILSIGADIDNRITSPFEFQFWR